MTLPGYAADWPAPAGVRTWQTVRAGGVSHGPWAALNIATHVADDPAAVERNRELLTAGLGLRASPSWLEQVHGARVVDLDRPWTGSADGAVTGRGDRVAVIQTADCLPVLVCDREGQRIGAAHAGWRGLAAGVLPAVVAALGAAPERVLAWIGPGIGAAAYEVGEEVRAAFVDRDPAAAAAFVPNPRGRWQADLALLARRSLAAAGVEAVFGAGECTWSDADRYFSHRREAPCGRQATLIWLDRTEPGV